MQYRVDMATLNPRLLIERNQFQLIHALTKDELNQQDRKGRTLLHWAVILNNWEMVKTLLDKGCRLDICDNQFDTPLHYSNTDSKIEQLLLKKGSPIRGCKAIHLAAKEGDFKKIQSILAKDKRAVNKVDSSLNLPIFYAALKQREDIVKYLIKKGAVLDWVNKYQLNLIDLSQINGKDTPISEYLKKQIGPSDAEMASLINSFKRILESEYSTSKKLNKRLVVVLGELHGAFSIFKVEKAFLKVAIELGISHCYKELPSFDRDCSKTKIELKAQKLGMNVLRIDDHLFRSDASLNQRNKVMTEKVKENDKDCIMIVGAAHIKGIMNNKAVRLPREEFHVVPFNLGPLASHINDVVKRIKNKKSNETHFIDDESNVIQVTRKGITTSEQVLKKHNTDVPSSKSRSGFLNFIAIVITAFVVCYPFYLLYFAVGLLLTIALTLGTFISGFFAYRFREKEKTLGLKEYKEIGKCAHNDVQKEKLKAFMDGTHNNFFSVLTSIFRPRDWRYMRDYYAGRAANEVNKEKLIAKVKARVG
jgi:hypothetical protein